MSTTRTGPVVWRTLMGCETEYAVTALDRDGYPVDRKAVTASLVSLAKERYCWLPGPQSHDIFLAETGGRLYRDSGCGLCNLEYATPECPSPQELVVHVHAGDRIVADLASTLESESKTINRVFVSKCNFDYQGHTSGSHENYLLQHRSQAELEKPLLAHLVSRVIYTGGGGFDYGAAGVRFVLSPRVCYLERASSWGAQNNRGIFTRKDEAHVASGCDRLHLLCGEGVRTHMAEYLRFGVTALIVMLIDHGCSGAYAKSAIDPLKAMQLIVDDPSCRARVPLKDGRGVTAIEIQRRYLEAVHEHLAGPYMPDWAEAVWHQWRSVLDQLESSTEQLNGLLDWPTKQAVFRRHVERRGIHWEHLPLFSRVLTVPDHENLEGLDEWRRQDAARRLGCAGNRPVKEIGDAKSRLQKLGYRPADFDTVLGLREELFELDIRYGELGNAGLYAELEGSDLIRRPARDNVIERAVFGPPRIGRAAVRGRSIRDLANAGRRYVCDWEHVIDKAAARVVVDMSDPFARVDLDAAGIQRPGTPA